MKLANVTLPTYTKGEEIFNSVSHSTGILLGIASFVFCFLKATDTNAYLGTAIFALSAVILYTCSSLYHSMRKSYIKKIMRLLDHSTIFMLITGTSISLTIICVYPYNKILATVMGLLSFILSTAGVVLTFIDHEKYKKVQMILYMTVGWMSAVLIYPIYKHCPRGSEIIAFVVAGGLIYTVGTIFYAAGKKKKYFHGVFHIFVLTGTLLHFLGIYTAI